MDKPASILIFHANCGCQNFCFISISKMSLLNAHNVYTIWKNKHNKRKFLLFSVASPLFFRISAIVTTVVIAAMKVDVRKLNQSSEELRDFKMQIKLMKKKMISNEYIFMTKWYHVTI